MTLRQNLTYEQTLEMTELALRDFCTWIYEQYGSDMTMLQVCIIILQWGVAQMADKAFFLARWIQAFSELSWIQPRANLQLATMLPRLMETEAGTPPMKLFVAFKVLLVLRNAGGQPQGQYMVKESGNLHLYPGTFAKEPDYPKEMQLIQMNQDEWVKWGIPQDDPDEAPVSMAELLNKDREGLELGELDDRSVISSTMSQKCI